MRKIIKLVIKTVSGYCPYTHAYKDKMTITENSISYDSKPLYPNSIYTPDKWSYKSTSQSFKYWFSDVVESYEKCISKVVYDPFVTDVGTIGFTVFYDDGNKETVEMPFMLEIFKELFSDLTRMIPNAEDTPLMLLDLIDPDNSSVENAPILSTLD